MADAPVNPVPFAVIAEVQAAGERRIQMHLVAERADRPAGDSDRPTLRRSQAAPGSVQARQSKPSSGTPGMGLLKSTPSVSSQTFFSQASKGCVDSAKTWNARGTSPST